MNPLLSPSRFAVANPALKPGVPFSTRLLFHAKRDRATALMGNRAFVRAWAAHRAVGAAAPGAHAASLR